MKTKFRKYNPDQDFLPIRDLLIETFPLTPKPLNWRFERWNYARYFVSPMLATYGSGEPDMGAVQNAIALFNDMTGVWENETGKIVGVVNIEHADKRHTGWGEAFFQRHPDYDFLLPEMLAFAEENLRDKEQNRLFFWLYEYDEAMQTLAAARGYQKNADNLYHESVFTIEGELPQPSPPEGYAIQSMADNNDLDRRRKAFGLGFNHPEPKDWPSLLSYQELQKAPDYRKELDLYVVALDGELASFCIVWWDARNRVACLEPVGTAPDYRRKGLARAVCQEAIRRVAALGAEKVIVGSQQEFYLSMGFQKAYGGYSWKKEFNRP